MHEMALAGDIVDTIITRATEAGASHVNAVYLTIGVGRDVVEDLFEGAFAHLCRNTIAENAELIIERTPYLVKCRDCGMVYHLEVLNRSTWPCPSCNKQNYELISGMEFAIDSIALN